MPRRDISGSVSVGAGGRRPLRGLWPIALAASAALHVVLIRAVPVRTEREPARNVVFEVELKHAEAVRDETEASETPRVKTPAAPPAAVQSSPPAEEYVTVLAPPEEEPADLPEAWPHAPTEIPPHPSPEAEPSARPNAVPRTVPRKAAADVAQPVVSVPRDTAAGGLDAPALRNTPAPTIGEHADPDVGLIDAQIARRIDSKKVYPPAARRRGIQGTVVCLLTIDPNGGLSTVRIVGSSGSAVLDDAAVDLVRRVFPVTNPSGRRLILEKAIRYSLTD